MVGVEVSSDFSGCYLECVSYSDQNSFWYSVPKFSQVDVVEKMDKTELEIDREVNGVFAFECLGEEIIHSDKERRGFDNRALKLRFRIFVEVFHQLEEVAQDA